MPQCMIWCLYCFEGQVGLRKMELPPMTLPQQILPDGAEFVGVGLINEEDAYVYAVRNKTEGMIPENTAEGEILELLRLLRKSVPQEFELNCLSGVWRLHTKDLEQDIW